MNDYQSNRTQNIINQLNDSEVSESTNKTSVVVTFSVAVVLLIFFIFQIANNNKPQQEEDLQTDNIVSPTEELAPSSGVDTVAEEVPEVINIDGERDKEPLDNTLYLAQKDGQYVLYYSNIVGLENIDDFDPLVGHISYGDYQSENDVKYTDLEDPIRIAELEESIFFLVDFNITSDNKELFFSYVYIQDPENTAVNFNEIVKVELGSKATELVGSRTLFDDTYPGYAGAASIVEVISSKYLLTELAQCFDCKDELNYSNLIINIESGKDILIQGADRFNFDIEANKVVYQKDGKETTSVLP